MMQDNDHKPNTDNKYVIFVSVLTSFLTTLVLVSIALILVFTNVIDTSNFGQKSTEQTLVPSGTGAERSQIIDTVEKANPAVVSIVITRSSSSGQSLNPFFDLFQIPQQDGGSENIQIGGGSGFFISSDGYIVTNKHVVNDETADYTVVTKDGKEYATKILAKDSVLDVAILKVEGENFPFLTFADSDTIKVGQTAIAIGNALAEFQNTVSLGIVSGLSRSITASDSSGENVEQLDEVIQTDAAINPGNSGGPLLDIKGNVIGVNVAVDDTAQSIGFSLPSNSVKSIADSVIQFGEIRRPYLGVRYIQVTQALADENNLPVDYGALVSKNEASEDPVIIPNSPADKAGVKEGDVIIEVDSVKLDSGKSLASIIRSKKIGQSVNLKIIRNSKTIEVKAKLERAPNSL